MTDFDEIERKASPMLWICFGMVVVLALVVAH